MLGRERRLLFSQDKRRETGGPCGFLARKVPDGQSEGVQLLPDRVDLVLYLVGWVLGWLLLWRLRPLPNGVMTASTPSRSAVDAHVERAARLGVAVVVPARNEAASLPSLLGALVAQLGPDDELVVVDDHSDDETGDIARSLGARTVTPPPLPAGWLGKPHACAHGVSQSSAPVLLFLDADVRPAPDLVERIADAVSASPDAVISVQPWHDTGRWVEQASVLCNVTALMGCGAFTVAGSRTAATVAFGPVLAVGRDAYANCGGHADPAVRTMHTEDIGMARLVGRSELFSGRPDTSFRMYPEGLGQTIRGWTRSIATGARFTPWWLGLATLAWVWSVAGGWLSGLVLYPLSAIQVWVLGRRAASVHPLAAALFPLLVVVFVVIFVRSLVALVFGSRVEWKGRRVETR